MVFLMWRMVGVRLIEIGLGNLGVKGRYELWIAK
jgi:hypothetical protein